MNRNSTHLALAVLRIGFSGLLLTHGIPKIGKLFADTIEFPDPIGLGATLSLILVLIAEVVGPLFVIIGYKTKLATIPTIIMMTVAVCVVHLSDPIGTKEMALLYLIGFIVIYLAGPGKYAIDKR
jgi:putative oxidoreductase